MKTTNADSFRTRIAAFKTNLPRTECGVFDLYAVGSEAANRLAAAIGAVANAIGEDLQTVATAVDSIVLIDESIDADGLTDGACVVTGCKPSRFVSIVIESDAVACVSDGGLRFLVAHEFRHVWQLATDYLNSAFVVAKLRMLSSKVLTEDDANEYAESLGFNRDNSLKAKAFGLPDDASFRTVLKHWPSMSTAQKQTLAEFLVFNSIHWGDVCNSVALDARLLGVVHNWAALGDSDRNKIEEFIQTKVSE